MEKYSRSKFDDMTQRVCLGFVIKVVVNKVTIYRMVV